MRKALRIAKVPSCAPALFPAVSTIAVARQSVPPSVPRDQDDAGAVATIAVALQSVPGAMEFEGAIRATPSQPDIPPGGE